MSYLKSNEMVKMLIDRIDDHNHDPDPVYDDLLQNIPVHTKLTLEYALKLAFNEYKREMTKG